MNDKGELADIEARFAELQTELAAAYRRVLRETLFSSRGTVRPASLPHIAEEEVRAVLAFLREPDRDYAFHRGAQLCDIGLGEDAVLGLSRTTRRFCLDHLPSELQIAAVEAVESYYEPVLRGFLQRREDLIVEEQERIRAALHRSLTRTTTHLEVIAELARSTTSILDLDELLSTAVDRIGKRLNLYYVGVFLVDDYRRWAILRAGSGPAGQEMLQQGYKLALGGDSAVGRCIASEEPYLVSDVKSKKLINPLLPETRSELALPLISRGQVIGAITLQSKQAHAFQEQDIAVLRILADQLSNAIENSRLFAQAQTSLQEAQEAQRRYQQDRWTGGSALPTPAFLYEVNRDSLVPMQDLWRPEMEEAARRRQPVAITPGDDTPAALAAPITLRGQVIGMLDFVDPDRPQGWTEDDIALIQTLSDQIALAAENARLFADAQRRAEQMATLNRIGLALSAALELESVLQTLYEQCRQVLIADTFYVALYDEETGTVEFPLLTGRKGKIEMEPMSIETPSLTTYIIQTGEMLYLPDAQNLPPDAPYVALPISDMPNHSYIGVPLTARGKIIGVLSIQASEPNAYSDEDIELLSTIATQASIAIENARAYERLRETAEKLREVDRLKTQFLANMSHELRTPLNSIIGFSRVMLKGIDGPLTELQETDLQSIYNSGQHLLSLINSILDMSKIEAGKMDLSFEEVDLHGIFQAVLSTARGLLKDRPIKLISDIPEELPTVWADAQRIRQVLINLVSNAAKFTEEGHIAIRATADEEFVTISVSDTGIGIDPEAQKRLFIPFQQVDASTTRRAEGTGLGLAISRSFIEMHGGEIWVESEPGKGSTFFFTLPVYASLRRKEEQKGEIDPDIPAVLVVDDDEGVITLLRRYLENEGYQVIGVQQSHTAVETARQLAPYLSAITLDVVMPNMDGWQILRELKQDKETKDIPVILCSIVEGLEHGLDLGAAACLQKPVTRDEIVEAIRSAGRTRPKPNQSKREPNERDMD